MPSCFQLQDPFVQKLLFKGKLINHLATVNSDHADDATFPVSDWGSLWLIANQGCNSEGTRARAGAAMCSLR